MAYQKKSNWLNIPTPVVAIAAVLLGCGLTFGVLQINRMLSPQALTLEPAKKPNREGMVKVPKSLVQLNAFEVVRRENVYNLELGDENYFWFEKKDVNPDWITDVDQIIGRVMAKDKRADFVFKEKDFLPEGSRSGIVGGIPVGKQGFFLEAEEVAGLRFLKSGDRFDLIASLPDEPIEEDPEYGLLMGGIKAVDGEPVLETGIRILVQNAEMIALTTRQNMTTQGGLELSDDDARGRSSASSKDESVVIAIDPEEALPLASALADGLQIHMVTRSGQENDVVEPENVLEGRVAFPGTARSLAAFEKIKASDLAEPNSGGLRQYFFEADDVLEDWIADPEQLIGRTLKHDVQPGAILKESDFLPESSLVADVKAYETLSAEQLVGGEDSPWVDRVANRALEAGAMPTEADVFPEGTKAGMAAAIPADRMALTLKQADIQGVSELSLGDQFDLLSSELIDLKASMVGVEWSPALSGQLESQVVNRVLARAVIVINKLNDQVVVAIRPDEISSVAKAVAKKDSMYCVALSSGNAVEATAGHLDEHALADSLRSDPDPLQNITVTETIVGGRRSMRAYRRKP